MAHAPTIAQTTTASNGAGSTTLTFAFGTTPTQGQYILLQFSFRGGTGVTISGVPSGFTELQTRTNNGTTMGIVSYAKFAGAGETNSYQFTFTSNKAAGIGYTLDNVHPTTPKQTGNGNTNASSLSHTGPTVNVTNTVSRAISLHATANANTAVPSVAGWNETTEEVTSGGNGNTRVYVEGQQRQPAATGNQNSGATWTGTAAVGVTHTVVLAGSPYHTSGAVALSGNSNATAAAREIERSGAVAMSGNSNLTATAQALAYSRLRVFWSEVAIPDAGGAIKTSGAVALSGNSNETASARRIQRRTATLTADSNMTASAREIEKGASVLTAHGELTAVGRAIKSRSSTLSADSNATAAARRIRTIADITLSGDSNVSADAERISNLSSGEVDLTGIATLTATAHGIKNRTVTATANSDALAFASRIRSGESTLSADSNATSAARRIRESGEVSLSGIGSVTAIAAQEGQTFTIISRVSVSIPTAYEASADLSGDSNATASARKIQDSGSIALSGNSNVTAAARRIQSRTATLEAVSNLSATAREIEEGESVLTAHGTATATARVIKSRGSTLSAEGNVTATGHSINRASATLSAESNLSSLARKILRASATLSGNSNATAAAAGQSTVKEMDAITLSGNSNLTASAREIERASSALSAVSNMTAAARRIQVRTSVLSGNSNATANRTLIQRRTVSLVAVSTNTVTARGIRVGEVIAEGTGSMTASAVRIRRLSASMTANSNATAVALRVRRGQALLSGNSNITANYSMIRFSGIVALSAVSTLTAEGYKNILFVPIGGLVRVEGVDTLALAAVEGDIDTSLSRNDPDDSVGTLTRTVTLEHIGVITRVAGEL